MSEMDLETLEISVKQCEKCELYKTRNNVVFGAGNPNSEVIFIGEGPGFNEDQTGVPFVGKAGKLLDKIFDSVDISREDIYIANIVKCRPPENRNPLKEEAIACMPYLREQVRIIKPKILVCLGSVAAKHIISPNFGIMKEHGKWIKKGGFYMFATYHPSFLLRMPDKKREAWEDFKKIKEALDSIEKNKLNQINKNMGD